MGTDDGACTGPGCCGSRREFLQVVGLGGLAAVGTGAANVARAMAGPFEADDFAKLIPRDKKLSPEWVKSLFTRGEPQVYKGDDLARIGMPVGGLCAGQLYLGGDGRLWHWDIFNHVFTTGSEHYEHPMPARSPLDQGFAIRVTTQAGTETRTLDGEGFGDVKFRGEYPIGLVEYRDEKAPVRASLRAFSPFIPLNTADSSLPATVLEFTVANTSPTGIEVEIGGWLENAVALETGEAPDGRRRNRIVREDGLLALVCEAEPAAEPIRREARPAIILADFEGGTYGSWKATGPALGSAPSTGAPTAEQHLSGFLGKGLVNTWVKDDGPKGRLVSPPFPIDRDHVNFLIGGGNHPGETCINLKVGGKVVRTATGRDTDAMAWTTWDVRVLAGKQAVLEIVDEHSGGWGHIDIDQIELSDVPRVPRAPLAKRPDFGTMCLVLLEALPEDRAMPAITAGPASDALFAGPPPASAPIGRKLVGAVARSWKLAPGEEARVRFAITWHFPNLSLPGTRLPADLGRHYATRFASALDVARFLQKDLTRLVAETTLWHDTWYDSTLPYWFLDRTFANTSILATSTSHRFRDGRFYGWEGVGCCAGTCTHVWHYAQAVARLFPELERILRECVDYADGIGFDPKTGAISHRAEEPVGPAVDGQAGNILRTYREHQMSADSAFLKRLWPRVKTSLEYLMAEDRNADGLLEGAQHNTLDAQWFGLVPWLSSLYIAALAAGEAMAGELGDDRFAARCRALRERGAGNLVATTWNERYGYFIQRADPAHAKAVGSYDGCEIDQVFGQHWAFQVGLGRILDADRVRRALRSLWTYNFTPDVGPYRAVNKPGRWYAMPGEAGLLMVTFPNGNRPGIDDPTGGWSTMYFNECMNGFEYQAAGHMIWEGMVEEGLAIARAIHDRYDASRRNPWNEVECGDHYARSMASYGVYLAACGFEYHGPKGSLAFAPRLTPGDFRAAFTGAEGWGTYSQRVAGDGFTASIRVRWGRLGLEELKLVPGRKQAPARVSVDVNGVPVDGVTTRWEPEASAVRVILPARRMIEAGGVLNVTLT
ncbi:GH116 family glycosyl-hydrolase [Aquisphaera insulae]|uniref:GH116 family glycosyl-hydrolase n=1 Tax=Aquisphaera insulae TaxID=2712864 RepID=UPI0013EA84C9|nr:GH116 family glycosyl-hydrolase [Aquisphaera insulae]